MRTKSVLKPKDRKDIFQELNDISRSEKIEAIIDLIFETDNLYDFLEGYLRKEFSDDIWEKMATRLLKDDKDESTGRYISLYREDLIALKKKPYDWFTGGNYDDEELMEAFLNELTDEEINKVVEELIK